MSQTFEIPLENVTPFFDFSLEILGKEYIIECIWNSENEFWSLSLFTFDKTPVFLSRKIVINYNLFSNCSHPLLPIGQLIAVDTSNTNKECSLDDLGNRVKLRYIQP